ncbi:hypothetical protein AHAS_Ahas16G0161800 [Arachis hypogaea]
MVDDIPKDGHTTSDSKDYEEEQHNDDHVIVMPPRPDKGNGIARDTHLTNQGGRRISSEVHHSGRLGERDPTELVGLVHGHQGQLEQVENELE